MAKQTRKLKKSRKAGAKKLEAQSKLARGKIRLYNKFIKTAKQSNQKQLELQAKIDKIESSIDEKTQKMRFLCDKKINEAESKFSKKIEDLNSKIRIESQKEQQALAMAEQERPSIDTEDLAMNPKFEKQIRKKKIPEIAVEVPRPSYADVVMGQTAGKKSKRRTRKYR